MAIAFVNVVVAIVQRFSAQKKNGFVIIHFVALSVIENRKLFVLGIPIVLGAAIKTIIAMGEAIFPFCP